MGSAMPVRVLIVDDHTMVAEAVEQALVHAGGFDVIGAVTSFAAAFAVAETHEPDVLVLDYQLPGEDVPKAIDRFLAEHPLTRILVFSGRDDERILASAIQAGCAGFVLKGEPLRHLVDAIRQVHAGRSVIPPGLALEAVRALSDPSPRIGSDLTEREREILRHLARGAALPDIAGALEISVNTVRNHVQSILTKLDAHSQREAVVVAIREGIVDAP